MASEFLIYHGSSALSDFRRQLLASRIGATEVQARYLHYVALYAVDNPDEEVLKQLLSSAEAEDAVRKSEAPSTRYENVPAYVCEVHWQQSLAQQYDF